MVDMDDVKEGAELRRMRGFSFTKIACVSWHVLSLLVEAVFPGSRISTRRHEEPLLQDISTVVSTSSFTLRVCLKISINHNRQSLLQQRSIAYLYHHALVRILVIQPPRNIARPDVPAHQHRTFSFITSTALCFCLLSSDLARQVDGAHGRLLSMSRASAGS